MEGGVSTYPGRAAALAVGSLAGEPRKGTGSTWYKLVLSSSTVIATGDLAPVRPRWTHIS